MSASADKIAVVALILGLSTAIARADSPPKLDVGPTCNAAAPYAIAVGRTKEECLADDQVAENTLAEKLVNIQRGRQDTVHRDRARGRAAKLCGTFVLH